jgi:hypothetical protein
MAGRAYQRSKSQMLKPAAARRILNIRLRGSGIRDWIRDWGLGIGKEC